MRQLTDVMEKGADWAETRGRHVEEHFRLHGINPRYHQLLVDFANSFNLEDHSQRTAAKVILGYENLRSEFSPDPPATVNHRATDLHGIRDKIAEAIVDKIIDTDFPHPKTTTT